MTDTPLTARDRVRLIAVTVAEALCVIGTLAGVGVFGGPEVAQAAGGALSADATLIAPATQAFSIWSVIYVGLAAYTIWQWLPGQRTAARHRRIGWWVAASMLLNALWLLVVQAGWLWASVAVIVALVVVLGVAARLVAVLPATGRVDTVVTDGTLGLYLGWVSVAVCANITAALVGAGVRPAEPVSEVIAAAVLLVAGGVGVLLATRTAGNVAIGLAMAWGIGWIAVARLTGEPASTLTGATAVVVATAVAAAAVFVRLRASTPEPHGLRSSAA